MQVRDPVHGFIDFKDDERNLLATPALQRLRGIKQLALASLVYPGAVHTRFDHTLGVTHLAGRMAGTLGLRPDDIRTVRLAALLHDIGHGPFSHVSEYALERYADRSTLASDQKKEKIHELLGGLMIRECDDIKRVLGEDACSRIAQLLSTGYESPILRQLVSGPLDADKQDYLLRDSYFCGVEYGVFDSRQLHRSLTSTPGDAGHELMIKPDGVHAVEQYVLAKYYLTTNVYRHRVRLITDQMIVRAIILGIEKDNIKKLEQLYQFDNTPAFAMAYRDWDDQRFMHEFGPRSKARKGAKCKELLTRLSERRLLKRVFSAKPDDFSPEAKDALLGVLKRDDDAQKQDEKHKRRRQIESAVAELLSTRTEQRIDPDLVIYHAFDIKSVKEMSRNDERSVLVSRAPQPRPFEEESALFRSIEEGYKDEFVEVYAPVEWDGPVARDRLCTELRGEIIAAIEYSLAS